MSYMYNLFQTRMAGADEVCGKYPYGYNDYDFDQLPPLCPTGQLYVARDGGLFVGIWIANLGIAVRIKPTSV